jgi:hypothetical protein
MGQHTLTGYVVDSLGQSSTPVTWTGTVQAPQVVFNNNGSGQVQLDWTGGSPVVLSGGQSYTINGTAAGLTVMLLTTNADYTLQTNGSIDTINAATGVTAVNLMVDTGVNDTSYAMWVGDGHVGNVNVPTGSNVNIYARGDLWNLNGPSSNGTMTGVTATDLVFANLDGSIAGVDAIQFLTVSGWLGTSMSQVVDVASGIGNLTAYGVGATVQADLRQDAGDMAMTVTVGDGGVPGVIDGGNVGNVQIAGNVNVINIQNLEGNFDPQDMLFLSVRKGDVNDLIDLGTVGLLLFDGNSPEEIAAIKATGTINTLEAQKSLTVTNNIQASSIGDILVTSSSTTDLFADNIIAPNGMGTINVNGILSITKGGTIKANDIKSISVGRFLRADIVETNGTGTAITVSKGDFLGSVNAGKGQTGPITVSGDFRRQDAGATLLVQAEGAIGDITVGGNIGGTSTNTQSGRIEGSSIGEIRSSTGSILLSTILATNGDINGVYAEGDTNAPRGVPVNGKLLAAVTARGGNIKSVKAWIVAGNVTAKASDEDVQVGGDIRQVYSTEFIPNTVTISAEWYIGQIVVALPGKMPEQFSVNAEAGAKWAGPNAPPVVAPLLIEIGAGPDIAFPDNKTTGFLGKVRLSPSDNILNAGLEDEFTNGQVLLSLYTTVATTNWTVAGPAGQTTAVLNAWFTELAAGGFGLITKGNLPSLSNNKFSIQGPSGK